MLRTIAIRLGRVGATPHPRTTSSIVRLGHNPLAAKLGSCSRYASTESFFSHQEEQDTPNQFRPPPRRGFRDRNHERDRGAEVFRGSLDAGDSQSQRRSSGRRFGLSTRDDQENGNGSSDWIRASEGTTDGGPSTRLYGRILPSDRPDRSRQGFGLGGGDRNGNRRDRDDQGQSSRYGSGGSDRRRNSGALSGRRYDSEDPTSLNARPISSLLRPDSEVDIPRPPPGAASADADEGASSTAIGGLTGTIVEEGQANLDDFLGGFNSPGDESAEEGAVFDASAEGGVAPPRTFGDAAFAQYVIPNGSGVKMVRKLLEEHGFLHSREIWTMGTEGRKRPVQPEYEFHPDGRIRMKKVSTKREGRRPWVPPAKVPFPDHPFRSGNFLKTTILHSLEEQGLIHKTSRERPFETPEEHLAAIKAAEKVTRKLERRAMWEQERHGLDPGMPEPQEPASGVQVFGWALGPSEEESGKIDEAGWEKAVRGERVYHEQKALETKQAANRQFIRRYKYKEEKEQERLRRKEDEEFGIAPNIKKENRRGEGLQSIQHYANLTGEDVSGWYEELGSGELDQAEPWRPTHLQPGGVIARKGPRSVFKPKGYPIV